MLVNWPFKNFLLLKLLDFMTFRVGCLSDFWEQDRLYKKPAEAEKKRDGASRVRRQLVEKMFRD